MFHPIILWLAVGVVAGGGCVACICFGALFSIFSPAQLLPLLVICVSGFGGRRVVLDMELSVNARYHKTRVLLRAWRLLLLLVAGASGGVRNKIQNYMQ